MKYENKRNGKVATVIEINEKFHTVMLEYNDGTTQNITSSTFKRWWKEVKEEVTEEDKYIEEVMEAKKEAGVEVMDLDPQDVVIVSKEEDVVPEEPKKVIKRKQRKSSGVTEEVTNILNFIFKTVQDLGGTVFTPAKDIHMNSFKVNGHMFSAVRYGNKSVRFMCRKDALKEQYVPDKEQNHLFDAIFVFNELDVTKLTKLLQVTFEDQLSRNSKKSKKEEN